jgi:aminoglycoside 6'-N-acetyltransferase
VISCRGRLTQVRPATDDDADLLVAWHADPDVSRYWDGETFTRDELLERLHRADVGSYIVEADGRPVGFMQAWRENDEPLRGGIDMFVVPEARGRGIGPDAAHTLTEALLASGWTRVTSIRTRGTSRRSAPGVAPASSASRPARRTPNTRRPSC